MRVMFTDLYNEGHVAAHNCPQTVHHVHYHALRAQYKVSNVQALIWLLLRNEIVWYFQYLHYFGFNKSNILQAGSIYS